MSYRCHCDNSVPKPFRYWIKITIGMVHFSKIYHWREQYNTDEYKEDKEHKFVEGGLQRVG